MIYANINGNQESIPISQGYIIDSYPKTDKEFWESVGIKYGIYDYFSRKGYRYDLRHDLENESVTYLNKLSNIFYHDAYIEDYVQSFFAIANPSNIDPNRSEHLSIRVIQSPAPDAYMLPNGTIIVSTGLLCTIDSEDELLAIITDEISHYLLDHQVINISKAEARSQSAAFWGTVLSEIGETATDEAWYNNDKTTAKIGFAATIGSVMALVNVRTVNRLGIRYNYRQDKDADQITFAFLKSKKMNSAALASALYKIRAYYQSQHIYKDIPRYISCGLTKRIKELGPINMQKNHPYLKTTSDVVTFNATMYFNDKRYAYAEKLIQKNIDHNLASSHDYVILAKAKMDEENSPETNEACMKLLEKAQSLSEVPNLDIYKPEILLLMRMKKQIQAKGILKKYMEVLSNYRRQVSNDTRETEWINDETQWTNKMMEQIDKN